MESDFVALVARQGGVFTAHQAIGYGLSRADRLTQLRRREIIQIRRGVYALGREWEAADDRTRHRIAVAAALLARGWNPAVASGPGRPIARLVGGRRSAAYLWQLPVRRGPSAPPPEEGTNGSATASARPGHVDLVSGDRCKRTYRAGVEVRPALLPDEHVDYVERVPVTSRARTAVDLMRELPHRDGVIVADAVLRAGVSASDLLELAHLCAGWPGGLSAVRAAKFADGAAASPAESLARVVCAGLGLPVPELQVKLYDSAGLIGQVDLLFRGQRTIVEVDGKVKYTEPYIVDGETLWREKVREDRLRDAGWEVVRVTWMQLIADPDEVGRRLRNAFARAARYSA